MNSRTFSRTAWWVALAAVCLLGTSTAFAQTQTAQSIMVDLEYDSPAYQIEGTLTWTYQRDTCAVPSYTAHPGVWNGAAPTCIGSVVNCAPGNQPSVPA